MLISICMLPKQQSLISRNYHEKTMTMKISGIFFKHLQNAKSIRLLLKNGVGMNIYFIYFISIQLCDIFQKCTNCLFEFQMHFSQNNTISDFIFLFEFLES